MSRIITGDRVPVRNAGRTRRRWFERTTEEIYAYRTDKPGAPIGLPFIGRHWGYAGRTNDPKRRDMEHLRGGGRYRAVAKPWSDLRPRRYVIFGMKRRTEAVTHFLEWFTIKVLLPVYNHDMNLLNLRRISLSAQKRQRFARDQFGATARATRMVLGWIMWACVAGALWLAWTWSR